MSMKLIRLLRDIPKIIIFLFLYVFYGLSFFFPRSKKIWLFDEWKGERFADNARYLFLYIYEHEPSYTAVWISHSSLIISELQAKGMKAYHAHSFMGLWYTLRSGVILYESTISAFFWFTGGILKVNLWHGLPIKKIVYDSARTKEHNWVYTSKGFRRFYHVFLEPQKVALGDYVLAQSISWRGFFSSAFRVEDSHVIVENQPRNDALLAASVFVLESERVLIEKIEELKKSRKIITYLPTFRDGSNNPLSGSGLDFDSLNSFLNKNSMHMFIKMHHEGIPTGAKEHYSNIDFLSPNTGVMLVLRHTDVLVTDYSSVYFEFLVVNRPIVFFSFDMDAYLGKMRDMYFDYDSITPGPKAKTVSELYKYLQEAVEYPDKYKEDRDKIRSMVLNPQPERSSEFVFNKINSILKKQSD